MQHFALLKLLQAPNPSFGQKVHSAMEQAAERHKENLEHMATERAAIVQAAVRKEALAIVALEEENAKLRAQLNDIDRREVV